MKVLLKKDIYESRKQYTRPTRKPPQPQKMRNTIQKKKIDADA